MQLGHQGAGGEGDRARSLLRAQRLSELLHPGTVELAEVVDACGLQERGRRAPDRGGLGRDDLAVYRQLLGRGDQADRLGGHPLDERGRRALGLQPGRARGKLPEERLRLHEGDHDHAHDRAVHAAQRCRLGGEVPHAVCQAEPGDPGEGAPERLAREVDDVTAADPC